MWVWISWSFQRLMGNQFLKIPEKRTIFWGLLNFSEISYQECPFHFDFEICAWMDRFSEIRQFPDFLETFPNKLRTIWLSFEIIFQVQWKAPLVFPGSWIEFCNRPWVHFVYQFLQAKQKAYSRPKVVDKKGKTKLAEWFSILN